jgi:hypothetical protein
MANPHSSWADRAIRWATTLRVVVLAGIAAVLSYKHMFILVRRYGETSWTSTLLPVSVDGMIVASSMTLLADSRNGPAQRPVALDPAGHRERSEPGGERGRCRTLGRGPAGQAAR